MCKLKIPAKDVKGFNYHPSYAFGGMEEWLYFDKEIWKKELTRGKECFPKFNTVRVWLSWNAYCRMGDKFIDCVKKVIDICRELGIYVIPCLFNRWHDPVIDADGIYIDHFLPNSSWLHKFGDPFKKYIEDLSKNFKDEEQILVWDICNEPLAYNGDFPGRDFIEKYELEWLHRIADGLRAGKVSQPIGVGATGGQPMETFGDISDVYLTHMYYINNLDNFKNVVQNFVNEAKKNNKEIICTECIWGSLDDKKRSEYIRGTLDEFKKHGIGFVAHALWTSGCADIHDASEGPITPEIGNLAFIRADGTVRPYHELINEY